MGTASYQQPNDYSLVDRLRPFELPYEATMQEIATKTQYWKVGADRVKSAYDQAVGLDPQFTQNREYLKNFMSEANKNLQKISKSDLGVFDNSSEALNVFKPLYDVTNPFNYGLLADSQINKHYQKQQQLSDTFRTKDNGKEWNQNNDFYFRDAQRKYLEDAKNGNLKSIDFHFQNKKGFIPYYDFKKEIIDIQEACKGESFTTKKIASNNALYTIENSKTGCSPQELALAFKTGLSGRAKQQAYIDGYANFKGNEDELVKQFTDIQVNRAQETINNIKAKIAGIKNGGVLKDEEERLKFYESQLVVLEPELEEAKKEFQKMTGGNTLEYVKNNYDRLAGQVYFNGLATNLAEAYRTDDTKDIVSSNTAEMLRLKLSTDRENMYIQKNLDIEVDNNQSKNRKEEIILKSQIDIETERQKTGTTGLPNPIKPVNFENQKPETITENDYKKSDLIPAEERAQTTKNVVIDLVAKSFGKEKVTEEEVGNYITELEKSLKSGKTLDENGKSIIEAYNKFKNAKDNLQFVNNQIAAADATVKKQLNDSYDLPKQIKIKTVDGKSTNIELTKQEISDIIYNQKTIKGVYYNPRATNLFGIGPKDNNPYGLKNNGSFMFNGKQITEDLFDYVNPNDQRLSLYGLEKEIKKEKNDRDEKINDLKTEYYSNNEYVNSKYYEFNKMDFGKSEDFENKYGENIKKYFQISGGLNSKSGYQIYARDRFGSGVFIRLLDDEAQIKKMSKKEVDREILKLSEYFNNTRVDFDLKSGSFYIKDLLPEYDKMPSRLELEKYDKLKNAITNMQEALSIDKTFNDPRVITIDSKDIPDIGTRRHVSPNNIEYTISLYKQQGEPLQYVARYKTSGESKERIYKAYSMDELIPQLY